MPQEPGQDGCCGAALPCCCPHRRSVHRQASYPSAAPVTHLTGTHLPPLGASSAGSLDWTLSQVTFLAQTSKRLAESLDYESTLLAVAGLALPFLGSWCVVDLVEPDGDMRRLAIVHTDPDKREVLTRLRDSWPPERGDPLGAPRAVLSRQVEVIPWVDDELLIRFARDDENLRILRALGIGSVIVVPLMARGSVHGALTLLSSTEHRYTHTDIELAEDLGARCAMAIDNARVHRDVHSVGALAAQMNQRLVIASIREQELTEQAQAASEAKSQFISSVSHEIRTPLNAIIGYTSLLELEVAGSLTPGQSQYIGRIQATSTHLLKLIEEVLDLRQVEAGRMTVRRETARVDAVLSAAVGLVDPQAPAAGVRVSYGRRQTDRYTGDEDRVRQILVNLLGNAVKFTPRGGCVTAACESVDDRPPGAQLAGDGPWVRIEITDTGIRIREESLTAVFQPFMQAEAALTPKTPGNGLGLAISRELARLMDGDLTVRSVVGEGSCFTLWLPAAAPLA